MADTYINQSLMTATSATTLYYIHDPMCSWCWGFAPVWQELQQELPEDLPVTSIVGGLAPDTDEPMSLALQRTIKGYWQKIESLLGTNINYDFWDQHKRSAKQIPPRRSTYPACRAVIAADKQAAGEQMIKAIQEAYYLKAQNPSDTAVLTELAAEIGLDRAQFSDDLVGQPVEQELQNQMRFARQLPISGFPSLVLVVNQEARPTPVAIHIDYKDAQTMLRQIMLKL